MLLFVIPILGLIKNYVKYKRISFILFMRTPVICYTIKYFYFIVKHTKMNNFQVIYLERCIMFLYKIFFSILTNNYHTKKKKYKIKYNMIYT